MAVQRVEWACPRCDRKYAIPAGQPQPKLCPKCQESPQDTIVQPQQPPMVQPPVLQRQRPTAPAPSSPEAVPQFQPAPRTSASTIRRKRYQDLRKVVTALKVLSAIVALGTLIWTGYWLNLLFDSDIAEVRKGIANIVLHTLVGGAAMSLCLYAFGGALQILIDLEEHARREDRE